MRHPCLASIILFLTILLCTSHAFAAPLATGYDDPGSFIEAISKGKLIKRYDHTKVHLIAEKYNSLQEKKYKVNRDAQSELPEGFSTVSIEDLDSYFNIKIKSVEKTHSDGIDVGEDSYLSVIFTKKPIKKVIELPGPTYRFADPSMQLSVPVRSDCSGDRPVGNIAVHDLVTNAEIYSGLLPNGTIRFSIDDPTLTETVRFSTTSEQPSENENLQQCEVGEWVKKLDTVFEL